MPELLHQLARRNAPTTRYQQERQQSPLTRPAQRQRGAVPHRLDRTEQAELDGRRLRVCHL
jgi:hypothetical protein